MSVVLSPGANTSVPKGLLVIRVASGRDADIAAFRIYENGKTREDSDFIFYGQRISGDNSIKLETDEKQSIFTVNLNLLAPDVQKVAFTATVESGTIRDLGSLSIAVEQSGQSVLLAEVATMERPEAALILGELYRRNADWKFRFVSQGFNGGLKPLAEHFGVDIASTEPKPDFAPPASSSNSSPKVNLNKVSLSKDKPTISLEKRSGGFGRMRINLNWVRGKGGFFSRSGVDLDLGAYVRLKSGQQDLVQALGNCFGRYDSAPFVHLLSDDRTGDNSEGEWLHINGDRWSEIDNVTIFTFIYEGAPNWERTEAMVTLHVPDQPPIETKLTEGNPRCGFCAIAHLVNDRGQVKVERVNKYFSGHKECDQHLGWGFRWKAGSK